MNGMNRQKNANISVRRKAKPQMGGKDIKSRARGNGRIGSDGKMKHTAAGKPVGGLNGQPTDLINL